MTVSLEQARALVAAPLRADLGEHVDRMAFPAWQDEDYWYIGVQSNIDGVYGQFVSKSSGEVTDFGAYHPDEWQDRFEKMVRVK